MSLKRWKTWPVEFSEDLLKIDKNLVTTKRGSCDHFLTNLKFLNPGKDKKNEYGTGLWDEYETLKLGNKCEPDGIP